jgi:pimeloyl-ACP methyl ester carboxylesterase
MSWFEHGDSRIFYEAYGRGEPLLLLPGFSQSGDDLAALRDALATRYKVIVADLPGSGRSQPQPCAYTASYYEDDAASCAALLRELRTGSTHLIGFSDGGEVALFMATLAPDLARSLVTWGAAGQMNDPDGSLRQVMYNLVDHPIPPLQGYRDFLVGRYGKANARAMTQNHVKALNEIIDGEKQGKLARAKADKIACPVLLITGEHDMFASPTLVEESAARIPHAETRVAEGAGHDVQNSHPEWLARTLLDWLQQR